MIISKPKSSTLTSIGIFLILVFALTGATLDTMNDSETVYWYHYVFLVILVPTGVGLLFKVVFSYKILSFGKGRIHVKFPARFKERDYAVADILRWQEVRIKTISGVYQQLEISFNEDDKLTLSKQEHTFYDQVHQYLQQKAGKKKIT